MGAFGDTLKQGAGVGLNILDLLMAARQGNLGQGLIARQQALQDPGVRANIGPLMAGFLGTGGSRQPVVGSEGPAIGIPQPGQSRFQANLPPEDPTQQLRRQILQGEVEQQPLRSDLLRAQVGQTTQQSNYLSRLLGLLGDGSLGGPGGGFSGLEPSGLDFGPSGPAVKFGRPSGITVPEGTMGPGGAAKPGDVLPSGRRVDVVTPDRAGRRLGAALDRQIKSLDSAVIAYRNLFGDREGGGSALDILKGTGAYESQLTDIPVLGAFTRGGRFGIPGARPSIEVLAKQGDKDAQAVVTGGGLRAIIARMTGEVGNLNESEQRFVADAFLPGRGDTYEAAVNKRDFFFSTAQAIRDGLASGQLDADSAKQALMEAAAQVGGGSAPGATSTPTTSGPPSTLGAPPATRAPFTVPKGWQVEIAP